MVRLAGRFAAVALLAALAGLVRGVRVNVATFAIETLELDASGVGLATVLVSAVGLVVHPFGTALAGYLWGRTADVAAAYRPFLGRTLAATVVGFLVGYAAVTLPVLDGFRGSLVARVVADLVFALGLVSVPLVALAGAALAAFARSPSPRRPTP